MVIMLACGGTNRPPALLHADSSDALPAGSFVCCVLMHMPPAPPNLPSYLRSAAFSYARNRQSQQQQQQGRRQQGQRGLCLTPAARPGGPLPRWQ